jgi:hypothetical protein
LLSRLLPSAVCALLASATLAGSTTARTTTPQSRFIEKGIYDDAQILYGNPDSVFRTLRQLGTEVVRVTLWWGGPNGVARRRPTHASDPNDSAYNWESYDRAARFAAANGIETIFTILGTPSWANHAHGWNVAPDHLNDLRQFTLAAARRYAGQFLAADGSKLPAVHRWIAWNEPNNPVFLRPQFLRLQGRWIVQSARDYAGICNTVVAAVKFVQHSSKVACGATAPRGNNQPGSDRASVSPLAFLRAMKRFGARGFDAYDHHPYYGANTETPTTRPTTGRHGAPATSIVLGNIDLLTQELGRLYGNVRLWITEYGYQTNPPDSVLGVSWQKQSQYLEKAWTIARANPRVDLFIWFLLKDEQRSDGWQSGLYTSAGHPKPSARTFASLH